MSNLAWTRRRQAAVRPGERRIDRVASRPFLAHAAYPVPGRKGREVHDHVRHRVGRVVRIVETVKQIGDFPIKRKGAFGFTSGCKKYSI